MLPQDCSPPPLKEAPAGRPSGPVYTEMLRSEDLATTTRIPVVLGFTGGDADGSRGFGGAVARVG